MAYCTYKFNSRWLLRMIYLLIYVACNEQLYGDAYE